MFARSQKLSFATRRWLAQLAPYFALAWVLVGARPAVADDAPRVTAQVTLRDAPVLTLRRGDGARAPAERAQGASAALNEAAAAGAESVDVVRRGEVAVLMAGSTPILELSVEDAMLAGDSSLDVHAARMASRVRDALRREKRRAEIGNTVFAISLVVFFGLVTLYVMRKLHEFATRARSYVSEHPESVPALHVSSIEVMGSAALRSLVVVSLGMGRWLGALGLMYAWLVVSLSLFEQTRPYTEKLTGFVISPLSALVARVVSGLPVMVIVLVAASALVVLIRLAGLFFASVERGETRLSWLEPDVAAATSWLVRVGLVLVALVFAAPLITGDTEGALTRIGLIVILSFGLASAPLLCSLGVGLWVTFSRGLHTGDLAEYGGERGRVRSIGLVVLTLEGEDGSVVRVPHLRALWHPTRLLPRARP